VSPEFGGYHVPVDPGGSVCNAGDVKAGRTKALMCQHVTASTGFQRPGCIEHRRANRAIHRRTSLLAGIDLLTGRSMRSSETATAAESSSTSSSFSTPLIRPSKAMVPRTRSYQVVWKCTKLGEEYDDRNMLNRQWSFWMTILRGAPSRVWVFSDTFFSQRR